MVYLAELLVVMTDRLKIVRIRAQNMSRVHGHKRLDDNPSLSLQENDSVVFSMSCGAVLLKHKKLVLGRPVHVWHWALIKKVAVTVCPLHCDTKSERSNCNKSSVM